MAPHPIRRPARSAPMRRLSLAAAIALAVAGGALASAGRGGTRPHTPSPLAQAADRTAALESVRYTVVSRIAGTTLRIRGASAEHGRALAIRLDSAGARLDERLADGYVYVRTSLLPGKWIRVQARRTGSR